MDDPGIKEVTRSAADVRNREVDDTTVKPCDSLSSNLRFETNGLPNAGTFKAPPAIAPRCDAQVLIAGGDDCLR